MVENAEIVFVGYGIQAPEYQWDDFKGADLKGKVLLVMNNDPADDPEFFGGKRRLYYGRWDYKYASARGRGRPERSSFTRRRRPATVSGRADIVVGRGIRARRRPARGWKCGAG